MTSPYSLARMVMWLLLPLICVGCASGVPVNEPSKAFELGIRLNDPYNTNLSIATLVRIGEPFDLRISSEKVETTIRGVLNPPNGDEYPLDLLIGEWESPTSNLVDESPNRYKLKLGQKQSGGLIASVFFEREVVLREWTAREKSRREQAGTH